MSLGRLFRDRYRLWRRRYRLFMLRTFDWYKRRYARRRIAEITPRNTRLTIDVEEDLFLLGMPIVPTLTATLESRAAPEVAKLAVIHVLGALGEPPCLEVLDRLAREAGGAIGRKAEKDLRLACRRLARKGQLPARYREYVDAVPAEPSSEMN